MGRVGMLTEEQAEGKALEYAGGIMIKRAILAEDENATVTPTTDFNSDTPCTVHYDLSVVYSDGRKKIIEGKTRSRKYRLDSRYIQDMSINLDKYQWVLGASVELDCEASIVGVYPWDSAVMEWDAYGEYEDCEIVSRSSYTDKKSKVTKKPGKRLYFRQGNRMYADGSDFEHNFRVAYKRYSGKEYNGTDY